MRITADVRMGNKSKAAKGSLELRKKEIKTSTKDIKEVYLIVYTAQNKNGAKYKINADNLQVFTKFVAEGKATIRFKEPAQDIFVSTKDVVQLKAFLVAMRSVLSNFHVTLGSMGAAPASHVVKKTRVTMTPKDCGDEAFMALDVTLESLNAVGLELKLFKPRIFKLRNLVTLDLSDNHIKDIPDGVAKLVSLKEMKLSKNRIKDLTSVAMHTLPKSLVLLDLSDNGLKVIPPNITKLNRLATLRLDGNALERLPFSLGKLSDLRMFSASRNKLHSLPGSLVASRSKLEEIDVSGNPFHPPDQQSGKILLDNLVFPSLRDLVFGVCRKHGIRLSPEEVPGALISLMDAGLPCVCGRICYSALAVAFASVPLSSIARTVVSDVSVVVTESVMCSKGCLDKYSNNPFAF